MYGLALRMLWHPQDAADATQDILIKVMTRLGGYRAEAALRTWVFRVAANHLLTVRRSRLDKREMSFEVFAADLAEGLADPPERYDVDLDLLEEEVKIGCTRAMLLCLDRCSPCPAPRRPRCATWNRRCTANACPGPAPASGNSCRATAGWSATTRPVPADGESPRPSVPGGVDPDRLLFAGVRRRALARAGLGPLPAAGRRPRSWWRDALGHSVAVTAQVA